MTGKAHSRAYRKVQTAQTKEKNVQIALTEWERNKNRLAKEKKSMLTIAKESGVAYS